MKAFRSSRRTAPLSPTPAPAEDLVMGVQLTVTERPWETGTRDVLRWYVENRQGRYARAYGYGCTREEALNKWKTAFYDANNPKTPIVETVVVPLPEGMKPCP